MTLHKEFIDELKSESKPLSWTSSQDSLLMNFAKKDAKNDWKLISEMLTSTFPSLRRSAKDCKRRWECLMNGLEAKKLWTEQEELNMLQAHYKYKNKWTLISESMKGWDNNTIKNKFYSAFRRIKGKIQKGEYSYNSKVELLEVFYFISLIEDCLNSFADHSKNQRKRGNDFINTLVSDLTKKTVSDYKIKLQKIFKDEGTMEDLFEKLSNENSLQGKEVQSQLNNITVEENYSDTKSPLNDIIEFSQNNLDPDYSIFFGSEIVSPVFVPLSAGPAAAASSAFRTLSSKTYIQGFSDASSIVEYNTVPIKLDEQIKEDLMINSIERFY